MVLSLREHLLRDRKWMTSSGVIDLTSIEVRHSQIACTHSTVFFVKSEHLTKRSVSSRYDSWCCDVYV